MRMLIHIAPDDLGTLEGVLASLLTTESPTDAAGTGENGQHVGVLDDWELVFALFVWVDSLAGKLARTPGGRNTQRAHKVVSESALTFFGQIDERSLVCGQEDDRSRVRLVPYGVREQLPLLLRGELQRLLSLLGLLLQLLPEPDLLARGIAADVTAHDFMN